MTEEFDCWAIHCFAHITEEGDEEQLLTVLNDGGENNSGRVGVTQQTPISHTTPHTTTMKKHKPTQLSQQRFLSFWSPIHQHWTVMMQTMSGKYSLV